MTQETSQGAQETGDELLSIAEVQEIIRLHGLWLAGETGTGRQAVFTGKSLQGLDLRFVNLAFADMRDTDMRGAILLHACFDGADMRGACLDGCYALRASFHETHLEHASLVDATLKETDFRAARLVETDFTRARCDAASFAGANMTGADLDRTDLREVDLSGVIGVRYAQVSWQGRHRSHSITAVVVDEETYVFSGRYAGVFQGWELEIPKVLDPLEQQRVRIATKALEIFLADS